MYIHCSLRFSLSLFVEMATAFHIQTPYEVVTFLATNRQAKDEWVESLLPHLSPGMIAPTL
jgi:hypothetical protein